MSNKAGDNKSQTSAGDGLTNKPDIAVFLSDDLSWWDTEPYGGNDVPTPGLNQLASEGMRFTHAFVNSPTCAPSRSTLFTALRPQRNGIEGNHDFDRFEGVESILFKFKQQGYEIVSFGKVAHGITRDKSGWQYGFDYLQNRDPKPEEIEEFFSNRTSDKPLLIFIGNKRPHVRWPKTSRFDPNKVTLPRKSIDTQWTRVNRAQYFEDIAMLDQEISTFRSIISRYLDSQNLVTLFTADHGPQWPFAKWTLYDEGIRVPLLVSYPGKIKPASSTDAMVSWIDILPTLLDYAGGNENKNLDGRSFLNVLNGKQTQFRDQIISSHSGDRNHNVYPIRSVRTRYWKYIYNPKPEFKFTTHMDLEGEKWTNEFWDTWVEKAKSDNAAKAVLDAYHYRPKEELYYLPEDEFEQHNLAGDPKHQQTLAELRKVVMDYMAEVDDQLVITGTPHR